MSMTVTPPLVVAGVACSSLSGHKGGAYPLPHPAPATPHNSL
jgi:hypothetical protein